MFTVVKAHSIAMPGVGSDAHLIGRVVPPHQDPAESASTSAARHC